MKQKLVCLALFLSLFSTFAQTLPQGVMAISGKVYAPAGEDIAGTVVVACFVQGSDCDETKSKSYEITEAGDSANFTLENLTRDTYLLFASKDTNANGVDFEDGDFYALYGTNGNVTPPARNVELRLEILGSSASIAATTEQTQNAVSNEAGLEPYTVTGVALDTKGQPLEGAIVRLRQDFVSGRTEVTTGADGRYKASSSVQNASASYKIEAFIQVDYNGQTVCPRLAMPNPNDYTSFTLDQGAERNFQWQLTGQIGNYSSYFGATISLWNSHAFYDRAKAVEVTLTPTGPLIDGSESSVIVREVLLEAPASDDALNDIPIGTYTLQAVLIGHDESRTPVGIGPITDIQNPQETMNISWQSTNRCGFISDNGVEPLTIVLDESP